MAALSRLWFVLPGGRADERDALVYALLRRPLAALTCAPEQAARAFCSLLAGRSGLAIAEHPALARNARLVILELGSLAARHPDLEILVAAPESALRAALAATLGLSDDAVIPLALRPGSLFGFDWPTGLEAAARPQLVGADLDWLPPWERGRERMRYPGGPGAAGTARG